MSGGLEGTGGENGSEEEDVGNLSEEKEEEGQE
jgi:hypothetical protein